MKRQVFLIFFLTVILTFLLSILWEFFLESFFNYLLGLSSEAESSEERWEYVFTTTSFVFIALIIPSWIAVIMDVKRKRAEDKLRLTQFSIDHEANGVYWMGSDGKFIYVNNQACKALGYSREELLKMSAIDISDEIEEKNWANHWEELKKQGTISFETDHKRKDGRKFPVEISANYLEFEGKEYNCAFAHDITKRKKFEKERENLIDELKKALSEIKSLKGFIPICASCKSIRNDKGYWKRVEEYVEEHSNVKFTHGICPDCSKKMFPDLYKNN